MKKITLITRLSAVFAFAVGFHAVSVLAAGQTNAFQAINLQLTFLTQGPYKTNSPATNDITATVIRTAVNTKEVIAWLGAAITNPFPANARLIRVKHFNANTNSTTYEVRFGTNHTNSVDVSQFFTGMSTSEKIDHNIYNKVTKLSTGRAFENLYLVVSNAPSYNLIPYFHVGGAATVNYVAVRSGKTTLAADEVTAPTLAGAGAGTNGVHGLVTGSVTLTGTVTEVK
jgi:hypothetical protein